MLFEDSKQKLNSYKTTKIQENHRYKQDLVTKICNEIMKIINTNKILGQNISNKWKSGQYRSDFELKNKQ